LLQAAGLPLKRKLWECRVSDDAVMPPGTLIGAAHFKAGQYLDITGVGGCLLASRLCRHAFAHGV
jgi:large subunit ribosomal protein L3